MKQATKEWIDEALSGRCDRDREGVGSTDAQAAERAVVSGARTTEVQPWTCMGCGLVTSTVNGRPSPWLVPGCVGTGAHSWREGDLSQSVTGTADAIPPRCTCSAHEDVHEPGCPWLYWQNTHRTAEATPRDAGPEDGSIAIRGRAGEVTVGDVAQDGTGPWKLFLGEYGVAHFPSKSCEENPESYARSVASAIRKALADEEHGPVCRRERATPHHDTYVDPDELLALRLVAEAARGIDLAWEHGHPVIRGSFALECALARLDRSGAQRIVTVPADSSRDAQPEGAKEKP